ncbi:transglycosylase SLT domain-containing protein [Pectobacterium betavasculorum]|uniref:Lytic transglycosylase n=1 Tax=Pectobacterium betavasculorum TaxID=55207 RepID=A0ABR4V3L0_9GAMM|nr:transglycosylase SLT domain-containing protein [Pectobacterium betavasculorum]KFX21262.1 lytic transglycosylase [Pectobacterium betavasculorum]
MRHLLITLLISPMLFSTTVCADTIPRAAQTYRSDVIRSARLDWGMNAPIADFAAQLHQESGWNPGAVSPVGALGLAQFMPTTADWFSGIVPELRTNQPLNPVWAIRALTGYDRWLWTRISASNDCERMAMTLSSYNGGLGWLQRDKQRAKIAGKDILRWFDHVETVNAGRSAANWHENRHYPDRILHQLAPRYLSWGRASCVE